MFVQKYEMPVRHPKICNRVNMAIYLRLNEVPNSAYEYMFKIWWMCVSTAFPGSNPNDSKKRLILEVVMKMQFLGRPCLLATIANQLNWPVMGRDLSTLLNELCTSMPFAWIHGRHQHYFVNLLKFWLDFWASRNAMDKSCGFSETNYQCSSPIAICMEAQMETTWTESGENKVARYSGQCRRMIGRPICWACNEEAKPVPKGCAGYLYDQSSVAYQKIMQFLDVAYDSPTRTIKQILKSPMQHGQYVLTNSENIGVVYAKLHEKYFVQKYHASGGPIPTSEGEGRSADRSGFEHANGGSNVGVRNGPFAMQSLQMDCSEELKLPNRDTNSDLPTAQRDDDPRRTPGTRVENPAIMKFSDIAKIAKPLNRERREREHPFVLMANTLATYLHEHPSGAIPLHDFRCHYSQEYVKGTLRFFNKKEYTFYRPPHPVGPSNSLVTLSSPGDGIDAGSSHVRVIDTLPRVDAMEVDSHGARLDRTQETEYLVVSVYVPNPEEDTKVLQILKQANTTDRLGLSLSELESVIGVSAENTVIRLEHQHIVTVVSSKRRAHGSLKGRPMNKMVYLNNSALPEHQSGVPKQQLAVDSCVRMFLVNPPRGGVPPSLETSDFKDDDLVLFRELRATHAWCRRATNPDNLKRKRQRDVHPNADLPIVKLAPDLFEQFQRIFCLNILTERMDPARLEMLNHQYLSAAQLHHEALQLYSEDELSEKRIQMDRARGERIALKEKKRKLNAK